MPTLDLSALPAWSQLLARLPDGSYDPQAADDCGETCVAAIVTAVHGTPVGPGSVRANLGGSGRSGLTTGEDLRAALAYYSTLAAVESPAATDLEGYLTSCSNRGFPTIVLGDWPVPGASLHWMATLGTSGSWQFMNPWGGVRSSMPWPDAMRLYRGSIVLVEAHVNYDKRSLAVPY